MKKRSKSYNQLLRATSILASSQLVSIGLRLARTKVIALLLGPAGIGLISLFQSFTDTVTSFSSLGLGVGAVKQISFAKTKCKQWRLDRTILIFRRWFLATALLGCIVCISSAYPISRYWFNNDSYAGKIILLSIAIFFTILAAGRYSILQGLRRVSAMAKANVLESIISFIISIAIYYYLKEQGVLAVFIANSIIAFVCVQLFYRQIPINEAKASLRKTVNTGVLALRLGIYITIGAFINAASMLMTRLMIGFFSHHEEATGLFQSAWTISNVFATFVISSAGTDYFARLCAVSSHKVKTQKLVDEQIYLVTLISTPIIIGIILLSYYILHIMYSIEFKGAQNMLIWQMLGIFVKLIATPVASILLARGKGLQYLCTEAIFFISYLSLSYFLLPMHDIMGVGISYFIAYIIYLGAVMLFGYINIEMLWSWKSLFLIVSNVLFVCIAFYIAFYQSEYTLEVGIPLFFLSVAYSIYSLSAVFDFRQIKTWFK